MSPNLCHIDEYFRTAFNKSILVKTVLLKLSTGQVFISLTKTPYYYSIEQIKLITNFTFKTKTEQH